MEVQEQNKALPCPICGDNPIIKELFPIHNIKRMAIMCPLLCPIGDSYTYWIDVEDDNITEQDMINIWNKKIRS